MYSTMSTVIKYHHILFFCVQNLLVNFLTAINTVISRYRYFLKFRLRFLRLHLGRYSCELYKMDLDGGS
jgi:hypothetical protein